MKTTSTQEQTHSEMKAFITDLLATSPELETTVTHLIERDMRRGTPRTLALKALRDYQATSRQAQQQPAAPAQPPAF